MLLGAVLEVQFDFCLPWLTNNKLPPDWDGGESDGKAMKSSSTAMNNKNNKPSAARVAKKNKAPAAKKDGDESRSPHG